MVKIYEIDLFTGVIEFEYAYISHIIAVDYLRIIRCEDLDQLNKPLLF